MSTLVESLRESADQLRDLAEVLPEMPDRCDPRLRIALLELASMADLCVVTLYVLGEESLTPDRVVALRMWHNTANMAVDLATTALLNARRNPDTQGGQS